MKKSSRYYSGPVSDHFDGRRFYAPHQAPDKTFIDILRWNLTSKRARWPRHIPNPPAEKPAVRVEEAALQVTMIGHAAVLLQTAGLNILVDPIWSRRASPIPFLGPKRARQPGLKFADLPPIDLVLVTHNHYDHLDMPTLRKLVKRFNPQIVTPLGNDTLIRRSIPAARVTAIDWDQRFTLGSVTVEAEPVQHWSSRWLSDRNEALWAGFTLTTDYSRKIFITGDTGYSMPGLEGWWAKRAQAKHGAFDLALLPIGAYAPRWFMRDAHMNPAEAVQAFQHLNCAKALAYHYGTFQLTDEAVDEPVQYLSLALSEAGIDPSLFRTLQPGQAWEL